MKKISHQEKSMNNSVLRNKIMLFNLIFLMTLIAPVSASTSIFTYSCSFSNFSSPSGLETSNPPFDMLFLVDQSKDKAYLKGNQGSAEVILIYNSYGWSFIEITGTGNVMSTTINLFGDAVHSRHSIVDSKILPSQYYGKCEKK
jgi:hypothetical protein